MVFAREHSGRRPQPESGGASRRELVVRSAGYLAGREDAIQRNYPLWRLTCDFTWPTYEAAATGAAAVRAALEP